MAATAPVRHPQQTSHTGISHPPRARRPLLLLSQPPSQQLKCKAPPPAGRSRTCSESLFPLPHTGQRLCASVTARGSHTEELRRACSRQGGQTSLRPAHPPRPQRGLSQALRECAHTTPPAPATNAHALTTSLSAGPTGLTPLGPQVSRTAAEHTQRAKHTVTRCCPRHERHV